MAVAAWWLLQGPGRGIFGGGGHPQGSDRSLHDARLLGLIRKSVKKHADSSATYQTPDGARRYEPEWFGPSNTLVEDVLQHGSGCAFVLGTYQEPRRVVLAVDEKSREICCTVYQKNRVNGCFTHAVQGMRSRKVKEIASWLDGILAPYELKQENTAILRPSVSVHVIALTDPGTGVLRGAVAVDSRGSYGVLAGAAGSSAVCEEVGRVLLREAEHAGAKEWFTYERIQALLEKECAARGLRPGSIHKMELPGSDIPAEPVNAAARKAVEASGQRVGRTMDFTAMVRGGMVSYSRDELA